MKLLTYSLRPAFWWCSGALICDRELPPLTQDLRRDEEPDLLSTSENYYGGRYFVCETINPSAAQKVVEALGGEWKGILS